MVNLLNLLATIPIVVFAAPNVFTPSSMYLPREAHKVAFDEDHNRLIAYDHGGRHLGVFPLSARTLSKRATGSCVSMSNDDIDNLPGIKTLRDKATKNWGKGKRNEVVNDKDLSDNPASVCADDAGAVVVYDGDPECRDIVNEAQGTLEGGKITLENQEGISMSSQTQVTKSSSLSIGEKISTKFSFPEIVEVSAEISISSEFTNTNSETNTVGSDQRTRQRIQQPVDEGQDCTISLTTKTCSITGKASLKMIATGMLWFEYEDKVDGHYKWGLVMESILPNDDDRSTTVEFKATGNIDSSGHFSSSGCTKGETIASS